jgi:hypothetical protein
MPEYSFTVIEHDGDRRGLVVSQERKTVTLAEGIDFFGWAGAGAAVEGGAGPVAAEPRSRRGRGWAQPPQLTSAPT